MATTSDTQTQTQTPSSRTGAAPADLPRLEEDRFLPYELGRLTERLDGLRQTTQNTNHLQVAAIMVVLALAAFGAWGFNSQLTATNARIDRLDDKMSGRLDRIDDRLRQFSDRVVKLEPGSASTR